MGRSMGLDFGLEKADVCIKRKFRWLMIIEDVSAEGINTLPPSKGARPSLTFKTMEIQHLNETIIRPTKPDWKPVALTLYDIKKNKHPVFEWIKKLYDPKKGKWKKPTDFIKDRVRLELYDGCGEIIETWIFENVWIETAEFSDLDMQSSEIVICDLTLRYDRAWIDE